MNNNRKPSEERRWERFYPEEAKNFDYPRMNIFDAVKEENKNRKDAIALEYEGNDICYGEFFDKVEEKQEFLESKGITKDDVVTVSMLMCPDFIYDWYALGKIGAVSNLIDPRTSTDGVKKYIEEADSKYILSTNIFTPKVMSAIKDRKDSVVVNYALSNYADNKMPLKLVLADFATTAYCGVKSKLDGRLENVYERDLPIVSGVKSSVYEKDLPLTIVHTGGTTGFPKGVLLSHDNYNAMAYEYKKSQIGFTADDRFLLVMPPWISYGSGMLHMSLITGMKAHIVSALNSKKIDKLVDKTEPQWMAGVPAHYKIVSRSKTLKKNGMKYFKAGAVGGDAMSAEDFNESENSMKENGIKKGLYPGYALTEATSAFAVRQLENYKPGSVGIPLPGNTVGIFKFDEESETTLDEELDYNQTGEICIRTPNMMLGYFLNDEATKEVIKKHKDGNYWIHTGDLGYIDEDGAIFVNGRIKEMITRYDGFKVYPSMIEKVLNANKAVAACKVVGVDDKIHGQGSVPKAYIVLEDKYKNDEDKVLKDIKNACEYCLPSYYVENAKYETIEKLPRTPIGKIDIRLLQEMDRQQELSMGRAKVLKK